MKYSRQRELVLNAVIDSHKHPTAYEVFCAVRDNAPNVSLGTVYRNLNMLCELGKIRRIDTGNSSSVRYDSGATFHNHIYCEKCGKVRDIVLEDFDNTLTSVEDKTGYKITSHEIILKGICDICR